MQQEPPPPEEGGELEPEQLASSTTSAPDPVGKTDGVLPAAGLGLAPAQPVTPEPPPKSGDTPLVEETPPAVPCTETTVPTDLILILDNSGSMAAETAAVERELPGWAQQLATLGLDYRLILLSRHRTRDRDDSEAASTSICVEQPLSGLARCPSASPVLAERFFHYSIKIDASDSLERALQGFATADAAGLAPRGWSEWLRAGALAAFVEISDADSDVSAVQFAARLAALAPGSFSAGTLPSFLFYSIVGLVEKARQEEAYLPAEPIESAECRSADTSPDNAGEQYQTLSVLTAGLRFPLCQLQALGGHLQRIAEDLASKARRCVPGPGGAR